MHDTGVDVIYGFLIFVFLVIAMCFLAHEKNPAPSKLDIKDLAPPKSDTEKKVPETEKAISERRSLPYRKILTIGALVAVSYTLLNFIICWASSLDNGRFVAVVVPYEGGYERTHRDDNLYILDTKTGVCIRPKISYN